MSIVRGISQTQLKQLEVRDSRCFVRTFEGEDSLYHIHRRLQISRGDELVLQVRCAVILDAAGTAFLSPLYHRNHFHFHHELIKKCNSVGMLRSRTCGMLITLKLHCEYPMFSLRRDQRRNVGRTSMDRSLLVALRCRFLGKSLNALRTPTFGNSSRFQQLQLPRWILCT